VPQLYVLPFSGKAASWDKERYKVMTSDPCGSGMFTWQAEVCGGVHVANWRAKVACGVEKLVVEFSPATECAVVLEVGKSRT
jgi:hypothetical protein